MTVRDNGDELDRLAANLNAMLDRIQSLMESLQAGLQRHRPRSANAVARLRQNLETAKVGARSVEEFRSSTDAAIAETDALLKTFSALLRIAQIESGSRKAGFARFDVSELFELVALTFAAVAEDQGHELVSDIQGGITLSGRSRASPATCHKPRRERHSPHPQRNAKIEFRLRKEMRRQVIATVLDNGPGIPEEERGKVLRRFYRLEASRTTPGSGLVSPWWPPLLSFMARALACSITPLA